jgi:hypothetical protein
VRGGAGAVGGSPGRPPGHVARSFFVSAAFNALGSTGYVYLYGSPASSPFPCSPWRHGIVNAIVLRLRPPTVHDHARVLSTLRRIAREAKSPGMATGFSAGKVDAGCRCSKCPTPATGSKTGGHPLGVRNTPGMDRGSSGSRPQRHEHLPGLGERGGTLGGRCHRQEPNGSNHHLELGDRRIERRTTQRRSAIPGEVSDDEVERRGVTLPTNAAD